MNHAVIGMGFGDEGKGVVTDFLTSQSNNPIVIRFSGGQQAGHTVIRNGIKHVFANFGSGSLCDAPTYWSKYCTFDPDAVLNEYDILIQKGISPTLFIDGRCPITTPYDKYINRATENYRRHGTVGVGYGATLQREQDHHSITVSDIKYPWVLKKKIELLDYYYDIPYDVKLDIKQFLDNCDMIRFHSDFVIVNDERVIYDYTDKIFEGSQGLLLDQNHGFFPHVTRANTGITNIVDMFKEEFKINLVTRAYQTRHGNGPMSNKELYCNVIDDPNETNIQHEYQGIFRKSILDLTLLKYGIERHNLKNYDIFVTCLEHLMDGEYCFTDNSGLVIYNDEKKFINDIKATLNADDIYTCKKYMIEKMGV